MRPAVPQRVLVECEHPLVRHKVTLLRQRSTDTRDFRQLCSEIAGMVCYEATRRLELQTIEVETPLEVTEGQVVSGKKVGVVPILRAGVGMLDGVLAMIPVARVGFLGVYRNEETLEPVAYYQKLPPDLAEREVLLLDPMLATGGSAAAACATLAAGEPDRITLLSVVAAPDGVRRLAAEHPAVEVVTAAVDERLDQHAYIVPGLGDFGDRLFGT